QGDGDAFAAFNVRSRRPDRFLHYDIANRLRNDLKHFQNGNTAADQRGERAGKASQANLMGDRAEDRQLDATRIPKLAASGCLDEVKPAIDAAATRQQHQNNPVLDEIADVDEKLRGSRQLSSEAGEDFAENGHD